MATAAAAAPKEPSLLPLLPGVVDEGAEGLLLDPEPVGEPVETVLLAVGKGTEAKVEEAGGAPPAPAPPGVEEPEEPVV